MRNAKWTLCNRMDCITFAQYTTDGNSWPVYCKYHASTRMVDVLKRKCAVQSCDRLPTHTNTKTSHALYCKKHASRNMVNVMCRQCLAPCCTLSPTHGTSDDKFATYCQLHASNSMIEFPYVVDVYATWPGYIKGTPGSKLAYSLCTVM